MTAGVGLKPLDIFAMGVRYLRNNQTDEARAAFTHAVEADATMCDAWLGRQATGEVTIAVAEGAYNARSNLGSALQTAGMSVPDLKVVTHMTLGACELGLPTHTRM